MWDVGKTVSERVTMDSSVIAVIREKNDRCVPVDMSYLMSTNSDFNHEHSFMSHPSRLVARSGR